MIHVLLDGDWVLYTAGFAGQTTKYVYVDDGNSHAPFASIADMKAAFGENYEPARVYSHVTLDPPDHIYHSAKKMIQTCVEKIGNKFQDDVELRIFVDGDGNYRSRLATIAPYKGNRHPASKPIFYNELRQYLLDAWKAEVVFDIECDDMLAITHTQHALAGEKSIIVGVDKDLLQVPGWHFNPTKGFRHISAQEGEWRLFVQAACGDPTDNIRGAMQVGLARAQKAITIDMPTHAKWAALVAIYEKSIEKYGPDIYGGLTAVEAAIENLVLVYLLREWAEAPRHNLPDPHPAGLEFDK